MKISSLLSKIIIVAIVALLVITLIPIKAKAETVDTVIDGAQKFVQKGKSSGEVSMDTAKIKEASDVLYNTLLGVGIVIDLAIGMVIGIRFMMASAEDKADIKQSLVPYIVGSFIIFGAFGIWKIAIILGRNL